MVELFRSKLRNAFESDVATVSIYQHHVTGCVLPGTFGSAVPSACFLRRVTERDEPPKQVTCLMRRH